SGLLAALFVFSGVAKLIGVQAVVEGFNHLGFPSWFRFLIGAIEVIGGVGLLIPRYAAEAASFLIMIMLGAIFTCIHAGESVLPPLITMILLGTVTWLRSDS